MEIINKLEKNEGLNSSLELLSNFTFSIIRLLIKKRSEGNVVIISLHKLGDTVFTIPAVKKIIDLFPEEKIFILTFSDSYEIYNMTLNEENLIQLTKNQFYAGGRIASFNARQILKSLNPKIIFDLTGNITSALLILTSRAKQIIGMNQVYYKSIYSDFVPIRSIPHLIDRYLDVAGAYNGNHRHEVIKEFPVNVKKIDKVLVHPFAGWKAKEWNLTKFIVLALKLNKSFDVELIAPANAISEDILEEVEKSNLKVCITKSLNELHNKIKNCALLISNDSGPIYIANVLGKATFSIYGPTNPNFSLPFGEYHSFIQKNIPCSPGNSQYCFTNAGLYCPSNECMHLLSVEEVYESLMTFINELNQKMNPH